MTFRSQLAGVSAAAIALAASASAMAQAPAAPAPRPQAPAAQAGPPVTHGAPIAGVCVVDIQGIIGASTVGRNVNTRLQQIQQQVRAELQGEQTTFVNDAKAFEAQRASLDQNTQISRNADLQKRQIALQSKAEQRQQELQATQQKAVNRIYTEMQPLITQAYQQKGCSLLLQSEGVLAVNPAMEISQQVVTALNAKIQNFTFDRERLDQAAAPAGGAAPIIQTPSAARPATPAPAKK